MHSWPGRLQSTLAIAWEYSLPQALFKQARVLVDNSRLVRALNQSLSAASWQRSQLACGLGTAACLVGSGVHKVSTHLGEHACHSRSWQWGHTLVSASHHSLGAILAKGIFPFWQTVAPAGWVLAGFALAFPFLPTSVNLIAVWVVLLAVLLMSAERRFNSAPSPVTVALALFAIALLWATLGSLVWASSLTALLLWATYLALYLAARQTARNWSSAQAVVVALMAGGAILSAIALSQWLLGIETSAAWVDPRLQKDITTRAFAVFDNPNILAGHLALLLPLALLSSVTYTRISTRFFSLACLGLIGAGLLATLSRGALLAVFLSIALVAVMRDRRYIVILLLLGIMFMVLAPSVITERLFAALTFEDSSARYRTTIWLSSWRLLQDYWLTGTGLGPASFAEVYPLYKIAGTPAAHTHNLYLQLVVELGLAGALAFMLFIFAWGRRLLYARQGQVGWLLVAILAAIGGSALHGLVENIWYSPKSLMLFWMLCGLGSGLCEGNPSTEEPL